MPLLQDAPVTKFQRVEDAEAPRRVCFVCTGNTCRSPMAAAVANALAHREILRLPNTLQDLATPSLEAFSAGLFAQEGDPIAAHAVRALEIADIPSIPKWDYHNHTAHTITSEEAETYDLLIGLTRQHAMSLLMSFPHLAQKITVFPSDISDPYGGSLQDYERCLEQICHGVTALLFSEAQ